MKFVYSKLGSFWSVIFTLCILAIVAAIFALPFQLRSKAAGGLFPRTESHEQGLPNYDIRKESGRMTDILVRDPELGRQLAHVLGDKPMALMRGHGNVVVAADVKIAVYRAVYTELNARLQLQAMLAGGPITFLDPEEGRLTEATIEGQIHRPWDLWKRKIARKG